MKTLFVILNLFLITGMLSAQNYFRSGIFLHHSTGNYIWGPNPDGNSTTTIPEQMNMYNAEQGFYGEEAITMNEEWWSPDDNEWATQHEFFEGNTAFTDINFYLASNKIIVIKSCFPSSAMEALGAPADTLDPYYKSVYNYKWHWRHIIKVMENHPDRFFAIWTNAPLEMASTSSSAAGLSKLFCKWAKDTLAKGLDTEYGPFPANVYVFDFFSKLTDANGIMQNQYRTSESDSHPNGSATDLVAPQFVSEIFDAAIAYETGISRIQNTRPAFSDCKLFPNPAANTVTIEFNNPAKITNLVLSNLNGQKVYSKTIIRQSAHMNIENIDLSGFSKGVYMVRIQNETNTELLKLIVQ
jgi:hypothetical protein